MTTECLMVMVAFGARRAPILTCAGTFVHAYSGMERRLSATSPSASTAPECKTSLAASLFPPKRSWKMKNGQSAPPSAAFPGYVLVGNGHG